MDHRRKNLLTSLMAEAERATGRGDWGDPSFVATAEMLLESCRATARLHDRGRRVLTRVVLRHLMNRLYLQAHVKERPQVVDAPLRAAVVVTGLPRTGTTLLHNLLSLDQRHQALRLWQALHPVPPEPEGPFSAPALMEQAKAWLEKLYELTPAFRFIHPAAAQGPEECDALFQNTFASHHFDDMFDAEEYSSWLHGAALDEQYAYYGLQLRALGGKDGDGRPAPWVLKSPSHLGHLPALLHTFPDAVIVHCHRHVLEAVPSYASLVRAVRSPHRDDLDQAVIGRQALERCAGIMEKALNVREGSPGRFVDVFYPDLVSDPLKVLEAVYEELGLPLDARLEQHVRQWVDGHPQHGQGVHNYGLEDFGLDAPQILDAFSTYLARFPAVTA